MLWIVYAVEGICSVVLQVGPMIHSVSQKILPEVF